MNIREKVLKIVNGLAKMPRSEADRQEVVDYAVRYEVTLPDTPVLKRLLAQAKKN